MIPESIKKFAEILSELPSIGPRQALRLAFRLAGEKKELAEKIAEAATGLFSLKPCENCFFPCENADNGLCPICKDRVRDKTVVAVLERETDLISLEKTKKFTGKYLVIGESKKPGLLSNEQKNRLSRLKKSGKDNEIAEIIIAVNPTTYGDLIASFIAEEIRPYTGKITRLGRGLPTGAEIEFADEETLGYAIANRK